MTGRLFVAFVIRGVCVAGGASSGPITVLNPVLQNPQDLHAVPPGNLSISRWPNFQSVSGGHYFIGKCDIPFTHETYAACVSPVLGNETCGEALRAERLIGDTTARIDATVVDFCSGLPADGLRLTAAAYWKLGGTIFDPSIRGISWNMTAPTSDLVKRQFRMPPEDCRVPVRHAWKQVCQGSRGSRKKKKGDSDVGKHVATTGIMTFGGVLWVAGILILLM